MTASIFDRGAGVYEAKLRGFLVSVDLVVLLRCLRIISSSGTLTVCPNKPCTTPSRPCPNRSAFAPVEIFTGLPGLINGSVTYCELDSDATLPPTDDEEETFCLLIGLNRSATVLFDFREPRRLRRTCGAVSASSNRFGTTLSFRAPLRKGFLRSSSAAGAGVSSVTEGCCCDSCRVDSPLWFLFRRCFVRRLTISNVSLCLNEAVKVFALNIANCSRCHSLALRFSTSSLLTLSLRLLTGSRRDRLMLPE